MNNLFAKLKASITRNACAKGIHISKLLYSQLDKSSESAAHISIQTLIYTSQFMIIEMPESLFFFRLLSNPCDPTEPHYNLKEPQTLVG